MTLTHRSTSTTHSIVITSKWNHLNSYIFKILQYLNIYFLTVTALLDILLPHFYSVIVSYELESPRGQFFFWFYFFLTCHLTWLSKDPHFSHSCLILVTFHHILLQTHRPCHLTPNFSFPNSGLQNDSCNNSNTSGPKHSFLNGQLRASRKSVFFINTFFPISSIAIPF